MTPLHTRCAVRGVCFAAALSLALSSSVEGQTQDAVNERRWFVEVSRYGKWASLAAAAGLITAAAVFDSDAQDAQQALTSFCEPDPTLCQIVGSGGDERYSSTEAEALFQESARLQTKSRSFLIGGQLAIVSAGTMFLIDLLYRDGRPKNIPFTSLEFYSAPHQLGLSLRF